jgi:hypothetical protein
MEKMKNDALTPATGKTKKLVAIIAVILVAALAFLGYLFVEYRTLTEDPNIANQRKIEAVVAKVEKLIELPESELPTLATISDTEQLVDQPFFANASVGDQVLLYTNARKAFLYSPSKNMIVEVASLNIGQ